MNWVVCWNGESLNTARSNEATDENAVATFAYRIMLNVRVLQGRSVVRNLLKRLAPQAGFEPATLRLREAALTFYRVRRMTMKVRTNNE